MFGAQFRQKLRAPCTEYLAQSPRLNHGNSRLAHSLSVARSISAVASEDWWLMNADSLRPNQALQPTSHASLRSACAAAERQR
jgi:hypothetical protein